MKPYTSSNQIKNGAILSYVGVFFNLISVLFYTPWMIKQIGQSDYGIYALAMTLIGFFSIDFGLGSAIARFLSKFNAEDNQSAKNDFLGIVFKLYLTIDFFIIIAFVFLYLFSGLIYAELTPEELEKFRIVFLIAAFFAVCSFPLKNPLQGILISHEQFVFLKFTELFLRILTVSTMIIVLFLGYRLYALVAANAILGLITIFLKIVYVNRHNLVSVNFRAKNKYLSKELLSFSIWTSIISVAQRVKFLVTPTILAAFAGSIEVSLFSIASSIEGYFWILAAAINGLFLPRVSRLLVKDNFIQEIENLMIKVGRLQLVVIGLLFIGLLTMGKEFFSIWLGSDFHMSYYVTLLLVSTSVVSLTQSIATTTLVAKNEIRYQAYGNLTVAIISLVLSIILSRYWGALGAGLAIFIGLLFGSVIYMNIIYSRVLKVNLSHFFKECHIKYSPSFSIILLMGIAIQHFFPVSNLFFFLVKVLFLALIYIVLIWKLFLNKYEKEFFLSLILRLRRVKCKVFV